MHSIIGFCEMMVLKSAFGVRSTIKLRKRTDCVESFFVVIIISSPFDIVHKMQIFGRIYKWSSVWLVVDVADICVPRF